MNMERRLSICTTTVAACLAALFPAAIGLPARAATYIVPPDDVLIRKADVIVRGRVLDAASVQDSADSIHTDIRVSVERVLKGRVSGSTVVVRLPGGQLGDAVEV